MEKKLGIVLVLIAVILFGCSVVIFYYKPKTNSSTNQGHKYRKRNGIKKVINSINNTEKQLNNITNIINATSPGNETTNVLPNQTTNTTKNQTLNNTTSLNNTSSIISIVDNVSNVSNITDVLI